MEFAAATGMRPAEWSALERRDVDRTRRVAFVRGTKTSKSRREVPLTRAALTALGDVPPRLDSRYVFTTTRKVARKQRAGAVRRGELPPPRVGTGHRVGGDRQARTNLRPMIDRGCDLAGAIPNKERRCD